MTPVDVGARLQTWPGMDEAFHETVRAAASTSAGVRFQRHVGETLLAARGTPCALGAPTLVRRPYGHSLAEFASAFHTAIEIIVGAWATDESVRRILSTPDILQNDIDMEPLPANGRIHLCRLDLHLDRNGGFHVLETNANCPAALMSSGLAAALWRAFLAGSDTALPAPLNHESPDWTAAWFVENATAETGTLPSFVALFREEGGNRLELSGLAAELRRGGVDSMEVDPRRVTLTRTGGAVVGGRPVRHGYWKLGMQAYADMRGAIQPFVSAVRTRSLFVQNGLHGRLVGDNKLCLAVLSDPAFEYLFSRQTLERVRGHIPWSRGLAHCSSTEMADIRRNRWAYVLKHPYDTRGRGIIVGRGTPNNALWHDALAFAVQGNWLVQRFCETTDLGVDPLDGKMYHHDVSLGLINGKLAGAFVRSGKDLRLNLAQTGRLHPVFMDV